MLVGTHDFRRRSLLRRSKSACLILLLASSVLASNVAVGEAASSAPQPGHWSTATRIDASSASRSEVTYAVSCPTPSFCVVVNGNGDANLWRDGKWSSSTSLHAGGSLSSVSCPTKSRCVAVSDGGQAVSYDGHAWTSVGPVGPQATYVVSCAGTSFCAAVGANGVAGKPSTLATYNGSTWSSKQTARGGANDRLMSVSCVSPTFCVAVNFDGQFLMFNGTSWKAGKRTGPKKLISVSCVTRAFCMAVSVSGLEATFNGTRWTSGLIPMYKSAFAYSVSCASGSSCVVVGLSGAATTWNAGMWSKPVAVLPGGYVAGVNVSCSSTSCMAVDDKGESATY